MFVFIKALCAASVFFFYSLLNFVWIISVLISEDHSGSISSWLNCKYCMRRTQTLVWRTRPFENTLFTEAHYHKHTTQIKVSQCALELEGPRFSQMNSVFHLSQYLFRLCSLCLFECQAFLQGSLKSPCANRHTHEETATSNHTLVSD